MKPPTSRRGADLKENAFELIPDVACRPEAHRGGDARIPGCLQDGNRSFIVRDRFFGEPHAAQRYRPSRVQLRSARTALTFMERERVVQVCQCLLMRGGGAGAVGGGYEIFRVFF